ncbi:formate dehydrogenase subunit gamma [Hydrogenophaga sp.]|uniref:formate dehydrogenase subunit gamma n=1 Tax=Hydrogenophaga sp. TaxID=1904254 RepID=UPI002722BFB4|nr:formate dehydrogenase subunit gamma [Hydrogenophaga sp.]MDO9436392.1 formate dehydrogenase subunit gamma [Hydrogenophaga sp.]
MNAALEDPASLVRRIANEHRHIPGGLLPALHAVQDALGFVPADAVDALAEATNRSRAEVHGVLTYYHHFRQAAPGRHVVQLCQAEACIACGANELAAQAQRQLGCEMHHTREDGAVTLEPVYCLGLCASSPAARINGRVVGRMTPEKLDRMLANAGLAP